MVQVPSPFIVDYNTTQSINALSGEIWDIDTHTYYGQWLYEQWRVEVLDSLGTVITSVNSPVGLPAFNPNSLDALPWTFSFSNLTDLSADVDKVRITFIGTKTSGVGLAFNNYNATRAGESVPEPTSVLGFLALSMLGVASTFKRQRK